MSENPDAWKRIESKKIADCRVFDVREDLSENAANGKRASFFVVECPDWTNVIALTEDRKVILIEQFRHGAETFVLEIPGGMIDENEAPERAARRELAEETGFTSNEFVYLGKSQPNAAIQNNWIYHYLALNCRKTQETKFDNHESVVTILAPVDEIDKLIQNERITHSLVLAAFHRLALVKPGYIK